jgi:hypothetical protein
LSFNFLSFIIIIIILYNFTGAIRDLCDLHKH